ncbi:MAG: alpha/beta hydrolase [Blastocatellia bacterium]
MKIILTILILLSLPAVARAETCLPIQVRNPEGNYIIPGVRGDIVYRRIAGRELALDAYVQKRGAKRPAVIVIHGGGWEAGSRIAFVGQFLEMLTHAGYNWFSIDYRLTNPEEALDDLRAALAFIRCHAGEFHIDASNVALLGEDTGAQMAIQLAMEKSAASGGVRTVVAVGGRFDLARLAQIASPTSFNALLIHGSADREVPPSTADDLCKTTEIAGGQCLVMPVEGGIHRAENWRPEQWDYKAQLVAWLAERSGLKAADHEPYATSLRKEIVFSPRHGLKLDAYVPGGRGPHPAVIIVHGGGWEAGDRVTYATPLFAPLARAGFAWFSIDYRLTPQFRHSDQLDDLREAIRFVHRNATRFKINPKRIAILGESASGQMVAQIATESPREVAAVVSFYGVYEFESRAGDLSPRSIPARLFGITKLDDDARATLRRYSPLHNAKKEMPPLLLICGTKDGLFAGHTAFVQELERIGARYDTITVEGAPHGIENWEGHPDWMAYKTKLVEWLKSELRARK